ncbi:MAG: transposase [Candidatus Jettenia sp.]|nr:MAG: transposase [Candidatus Jettenia sp.]
MSNTYSQIYIQIVFAVKDRLNLIQSRYREELHKYITGIVQYREHKMLSIFCMPDHTHLLVGLKPSIAISDLARDIKAGLSNFIKEEYLDFLKKYEINYDKKYLFGWIE